MGLELLVSDLKGITKRLLPDHSVIVNPEPLDMSATLSNLTTAL